MDDGRRTAITGTGFCVPPTVRTNDDPIFEWLKQNDPAGMNLFTGYKERRVLSGPGGASYLPTKLVDLMVPAARQAVDGAGITIEEIDVILGDGSVGDYIAPAVLAEVHHELGLNESTWLAPVNSMAVFNIALVLAHDLVDSGRARNALIVCGCNWTQHVSYRTPQSVSAADGAGAAVVGRTTDPGRFAVAGVQTICRTASYGAMYMAGDPICAGEASIGQTNATFHINPEGFELFKEFGMEAPPKAVAKLLDGAGLGADEVSLISHQASAVLMEQWKKSIRPRAYLETLETFANMVAATIPVNLAFFHDRVETNALVLLAMGTEFLTSAVLLRRERNGE